MRAAEAVRLVETAQLQAFETPAIQTVELRPSLTLIQGLGQQASQMKVGSSRPDLYVISDDSPEASAISTEDRVLADVDHFNRLRGNDGKHKPWVLDEMRKNYVTGIKENAMPGAVSTTYQKYRDGNFWWLDQTEEQTARSGYKRHELPAARERVGVEVQEAISFTSKLRPGYIRLLVSPKMSRADASYKEAKKEDLADEDMVRIHMPDTDKADNIQGKFMQSVLASDIPLSAWVSLFRDPDNIFGKAVEIKDEASALSIMRACLEIEVPIERLPEGAVSIIEAVLPHVDEANRAKVAAQLAEFRTNQENLHQTAVHSGERWFQFDVSLADSLHQGYATSEIQSFIDGLAHQWDDDIAAQIQRQTTSDGRLTIERSLAAKLAVSRQNTLIVPAAVVTGNKKVLAQLSPAAAQRIYTNEMFIQTMAQDGYSNAATWAVEQRTNQVVAQQNVIAGGGCMGSGTGSFKGSGKGGSSKEGVEGADSDSDEDCPEIKNGQIVRCPHCEKIVKAKVSEDRKKIYCSNPDCKLVAPEIHAKERVSKRHQIAKYGSKMSLLGSIDPAKSGHVK
jgi:hypothetical protein